MIRTWPVVIALCAAMTSACADYHSQHRVVSDAGDTNTRRSADVPPFTSGTRLRAVYSQGPADARVLLHWHDRQLDVDCSFSAPIDGESYCLPADARVDYYADAQCLEPALMRSAHETPGTLLSRQDVTCKALPDVFRMQGELKELFSGGPSSCHAFVGVEGSGPGWALQPVPRSELVHAREQIDRTDGRIARVTLIADDGTHQVISGYDTQRQQPTVVRDESSTHWTPRGVAASDGERWFSDDKCTVSAAARPGDVPHGGADCPIGAVYHAGKFYELAAPLERAEVRLSANGNCTAVGGPAFGTTLFKAGALIPDTAWSAGSLLPVGQSRIKVEYMGASDGTPIAPTGYFWDSHYKQRCFPALAEDGMTRCLPVSHLGLIKTYRDDKCQQAIRAVDIDSVSKPFDLVAPPLVTVFTGVNVVYKLVRRCRHSTWTVATAASCVERPASSTNSQQKSRQLSSRSCQSITTSVEDCAQTNPRQRSITRTQ